MSLVISDGKPEPGMLPSEPVHVAVIISLTVDGGIHIGMSQTLTDIIGFSRANAFNEELAELFALRVAEGELRFTEHAN
jgi:hypothetical protein